MRLVLAPLLLRALRLLLLLPACGWGPVVGSPIWSNSDELVHLYTAEGNMRSFHLQILPDGRVDRTPSQTVDSAVIIKTVSAGHVRIIGAKSKLNLCMDSNGNLFGSRSFSIENCVFKHTLLENAFDVYESLTHHFLVSLGNVKGQLAPNTNLPRFSQFLTRRNEIPLSEFITPKPREEDTRDHDASNPCGGILAGQMPEDIPFVHGSIHPCLMDREEDRDPLNAILNGKFKSPRTGS
ncbi:fibroblast growth factor 23-like [Pseudonaja textilis]|uniref:fibroblast growth factor 23-like n=1 Tax=Pseudonaja textilis TaxID=8673 RepID=UPI000EA9EB71|nr:fibroblast growth factor 23-like [Pseudonaja textilis]